MVIRSVHIRNFGGISQYDATFLPGWQLLSSSFSAQMKAALGFLLCSKVLADIPAEWLGENTSLSAEICLGTQTFRVCAKPVSGRLRLFAADRDGADVTGQYQYTLEHCAEQDGIESFDGNDQSLPFRLCWYWDRQEGDGLSAGTQRRADTKLFRKYLRQYIQDFQPERICCEKAYQVMLDAQGEFRVLHPNISGEICLSETEQKLFRYICFLNVAEFWAGFEAVRDLHHKKKPLLIQNFVEFLDESANIPSLVARTQTLHRQIIVLTNPMDEETKKKWMVEENGILF